MSFTLMMTRWLSVSRRGNYVSIASQGLGTTTDRFDNLNIIFFLLLSLTFFVLIVYHNVDSQF